MTTTQSPAAPTRTYADYAAPLWRRWLLTREMAVIALIVAVFVYATINVDNFDGPLTVKFLLLDIAPDPADRPADDADHHHRRDRPVGREHRGPEQRAARRPPRRRHVDPGRRGPRPAGRAGVRRPQRLPRRRTSGCRRSPSPSARSRSSAASPSACSAPRRSPTSPRSGPTSPSRTIGETPDPAGDDPVRGAGHRLRRAAALHAPSAAASTRSGSTTRRPTSPASTSPRTKFILFVLCRRGLGLRRHLLHAALRQRPRRQRHRLRAPGDRRGPPRRRLDLRRPRPRCTASSPASC